MRNHLLRWLPVSLLLLVLLLFVAPAALADMTEQEKTTTYVEFEDEAVERAIRSALGLSSEDNVSIAQMESITELDLSYSNAKTLDDLRSCKNIEALYASWCGYSDISSLADLKQLRSLELSHNQIHDISPLKGLSNLAYLSLSANALQDISALSGLTKLSELNLEDNAIQDIGALRGLTQLRLLNLANNPIQDIGALANLMNMQFLDISSLKITSIAAINALPKLSQLNVNNDAINPAELSAFTKLHSLFASNIGLSDISFLKRMTELNDLRISNNSITDISSIAFLPKLMTLALNNNDITDISALKDAKSIQHLLLQNNQIYDISPLASLSDTLLYELNLQGNLITDISPIKGIVYNGCRVTLPDVAQIALTADVTESGIRLSVEAPDGMDYARFKIIDGSEVELFVSVTEEPWAEWTDAQPGFYKGIVFVCKSNGEWYTAETDWIMLSEPFKILNIAPSVQENLTIANTLEYRVVMNKAPQFLHYTLYDKNGNTPVVGDTTEWIIKITPPYASDFLLSVVGYDGVTWSSKDSDWVRVAGDTAVLNGVTASATSVKPGESVTFAIDMTGPFQFASYKVYDRQGAEVASTVSYEKAYAFTPTAAGEYYCEVVVYDGANWLSAKTDWIRVQADETKVNALTSKKGEYALGETMAFTIDMTGTLNFAKFTVYNHYGVEVASEIAYGKGYTFTPTYADDYYCEVVVYDGANWHSAKTGWIPVKGAETKVNALTSKKGAYALGETMAFTIDMTGTLNFAKFTVYNHYGVEVASEIAYGKGYTFTPTYADDYYCDVVVYDGANWFSAKTGWIPVR